MQQIVINIARLEEGQGWIRTAVEQDGREVSYRWTRVQLPAKLGADEARLLEIRLLEELSSWLF